MTSVFHRTPRDTYPTAVRGDGAYLIDADGKRYLDASGGAAVSCLGHSDARVVAAIQRQLGELPFAHTAFFTSRPAEELAEHLAQAAPGTLNHVYFVSGGSEAVEAALKLARQYAVERGEPQRHRFIARRQSYHGNTLGALAVGHNPGRRALYEPLLMPVEHVSPCYAYRGLADGETAEGYGARLAGELEETIARVGPDSVLAFVAETVSGATLGAATPVPGYFRRIREVCDRHGVLLILDEVMCGMGRTGTLFACEQDGVAPDIVAVAKGLGAGYQPIGLDHFALPGDAMARAARTGRLRRNFQGYTVDGAAALLGLGATAISALPQGYVQNLAETGAYARAVAAGTLPVARGYALDGEDRLRAAVIERLMCDLTVDLAELAREHGRPADHLAPELLRCRGFARDGLARIDGSRLTVLEPGRPALRVVAATFDAHLAPAGAEPRRHAVAV